MGVKKSPPWSKLLTASIVLLVYGFIIWACCEMHRLNDLSPIAYIGTAIIGLLAAVVAAYMWRAKQHDIFVLSLRKAEEMAKLRQEYGDNLQETKLEQPDQEGYSRYNNMDLYG